ncbi:ribbon-helix-helix CopG family protein [Tumebacillus permanentifrigoris]|uniref:Ribbon-helix-helix CopG family protein n=2 Tax=Tumebacillus TaxID=432330 RepID=A0A316D3H3_9BACL|nr:ribbon-helix-helix CopG family protein [Tumebacillus permanentifrigoris]
MIHGAKVPQVGMIWYTHPHALTYLGYDGYNTFGCLWRLGSIVAWRCRVLSKTKRIMVSVPNHLLQEVDGIVEAENLNRSEFIREAMNLYLLERKKRYIRESMQKGYLEMAKINLNIASEAFLAEEEAETTLDRLVSGV